MKKMFYLLVSSILFVTSINVFAADNCVLPDDNTAWGVGTFDNNGNTGAAASTPWVFKNDGTLSAAGSSSWTATWTRNACDKVHVVLTTSSGATDIFDVIFVSSSRFVAVKEDNMYRFGKKQ